MQPVCRAAVGVGTLSCCGLTCRSVLHLRLATARAGAGITLTGSASPIAPGQGMIRHQALDRRECCGAAANGPSGTARQAGARCCGHGCRSHWHGGCAPTTPGGDRRPGGRVRCVHVRCRRTAAHHDRGISRCRQPDARRRGHLPSRAAMHHEGTCTVRCRPAGVAAAHRDRVASAAVGGPALGAEDTSRAAPPCITKARAPFDAVRRAWPQRTTTAWHQPLSAARRVLPRIRPKRHRHASRRLLRQPPVGPGGARDDRRATRGHDAEVGGGAVACRERRCTRQAAAARAEPGAPVGAGRLMGGRTRSGGRQQRRIGWTGLDQRVAGSPERHESPGRAGACQHHAERRRALRGTSIGPTSGGTERWRAPRRTPS
jgi:hypothetical protein